MAVRSKTRAREAAKIDTPEDVWPRLNKGQRATLEVMGEVEPIAVPNKYVPALLSWWLIKAQAKGFVLTAFGVQTRDYGRANP